MFKELDDFNGYGYFYDRLYWTGFGFQANIVEEYVLLGALLHIFVGLKRTWDQKLSSGLMSGQLDLAITGLMFLTFMTIHLFQFRFADTEQYFLRPPPTLINWWPSWLITLTFFACLGWAKLTLAPPFGIPKKHQCCVKFYGYLILWVIGLTYISFHVYVTLTQPKDGHIANYNHPYPTSISAEIRS